ncbi:hypothetical protein OBBRIDRAFT_363520 [Obba rivulosa]|uniref:Uncharacterized protein n=1 Tax=Obba rivulosa TaxID=1052685 RepID=A0A8E2DUZ3_9APHY|nr:hypothetical protein OBBRIDRAFT_363520 [Obba rivulosa]
MPAAALRIAVIVIEAVGIVLLALLLATPARKHAIVDALVLTSILRSLLDVIPPILREAMPGRFANLESHMSLLRFCIADQVIVRYLTVVKAAFIVDFTLPVLYLAFMHREKRKHLGPVQTCQFYRRTIVTFCAVPFVWALPVLLVPLRTLARNPFMLQPSFYAIHCIIVDDAFQIVSIVLTMVPMTMALIASIAIIVFLWKSCNLPILSQTLGVLDIVRIYRFGALCLTIVISAVLYCAVLANWAEQHDFNYTIMSVSIVWEAICPCIIFLIFFAQQEVYDIWRDYCLRLLRCQPQRSCHGPSTAPDGLDTSVDSSEECQRDAKLPPVTTNAANIRSGQISVQNPDNSLSIPPRSNVIHSPPSRPTLPGQILYFDQSTFSQPMVYPSQLVPYPPHRPRPLSQAPILSLTPPPRPIRSRSQSPAEPTREPAFTHMPSLTAFGGRGSSENASKSSMVTGDDLPEQEAVARRGGSQSREGSRPLTASSSRTFGDSSSIVAPSYVTADL